MISIIKALARLAGAKAWRRWAKIRRHCEAVALAIEAEADEVEHEAESYTDYTIDDLIEDYF